MNDDIKVVCERLRKAIAEGQRYDELCECRDWETIELEKLNPVAPSDADILALIAYVEKQQEYKTEVEQTHREYDAMKQRAESAERQLAEAQRQIKELNDKALPRGGAEGQT